MTRSRIRSSNAAVLKRAPATWAAGLALLTLVACSSEPASPPAGDLDGSVDVADDTPAVPDMGELDTPAMPEVGPGSYLRSYPAAGSFPAPRGRVWRRAIIHLHSTHSHDACDGEPRPEGRYNLACLATLREALCQVHADFAYLTDHPTHMAATPFEDLLLYDPQAGDELVFTDDSAQGVAMGNRITCDDDFVVTTTVGTEASLMPVAFRGHLDPDPEVREALLGRSDSDAVSAFREGGAFVLTSHTEGRASQEILALGLDGIEIYNLHANIDPRIRQEDLNLESGDIFRDILPFALRSIDTSPDLALLAFLEENRPALDTWAVALAVGPMVGVAGTDAHQNVLPQPMIDGERFDSYRRMMAWFSNYALAEDESLAAFDDALRAGRLFVGFDTLASPSGFDFAAQTGANGPRVEMGETVALSPELVFDVTIPQPAAVAGQAPDVRASLLAADEGGWQTVAEWGSGEQTWGVAQTGIYRVEVHITPRHLAPYLDASLGELAERELPWIYGNPIRVTP